MLGLGATAAAVAPAACTRPDEMLDEFEELLGQQDSATVALAQWCRARGLADEPTITARRLGGPVPRAPDDVRELLAVREDQPLGFRHVRLMCGNLVLSEARNWYVPGRLSAGMNHQLDQGDRPFGQVIAPLGFRRGRLGRLRGAGAGCPPATVLTNKAVILDRSGTPLAVVLECYQPGIFAPRGG